MIELHWRSPLNAQALTMRDLKTRVVNGYEVTLPLPEKPMTSSFPVSNRVNSKAILSVVWQRTLLVIVVTATFASVANHTREIQAQDSDGSPAGIHLFVLSGQSNMAGLDPEISFVPAVEAAFGKENVVVVKDAQGGQPIRRWYKKWKATDEAKPPKIGDLYDRLMTKVQDAIKDRQLKSVTFVWMQGERDAREQLADRYAEAFEGVVDQLKQDLHRQQLNVVIGRLSDFDMNNQRYRDWTKIREVQVKLAESHEEYRWVDTDDLNDGVNANGKPISDDLHYSVEGYKTLGNRFAEQAIELIRR